MLHNAYIIPQNKPRGMKKEEGADEIKQNGMMEGIFKRRRNSKRRKVMACVTGEILNKNDCLYYIDGWTFSFWTIFCPQK